MSNKVIIVDGDLPEDWLGLPYYAMDIETDGLDTVNCNIAMVQVYNKDKGVIFVRNLSDNPVNLLKILADESSIKIFHHALFDIQFLVNRYYKVMEKPKRVYDTKVMASASKKQLIDPTTGKHSVSLRSLVYNEVGILLDKSIAVSDWFTTLTPEQMDYAAKDVLYLADLYRVFYKIVRGNGNLQTARATQDKNINTAWDKAKKLHGGA